MDHTDVRERAADIVGYVAEPAEGVAIRQDADFVGATQALLAALDQEPDANERVSLLNRVARNFGDDWFAAFVKVLCIVGQSRDQRAKELLADALCTAIQKGDMPSGFLTPWGIPSSMLVLSPTATTSFFQRAARRSLDPIEYLCAWYSQATHLTPLGDMIFRESLTALLALFNALPQAAAAYQAKLASDALNHPEGTFTEATRSRLLAIAEEWRHGLDPQTIAANMLRFDRGPIRAEEVKKDLLAQGA